ncbi:MAG TPA: tetratricopeptide repeat protein [Xenococcaceae cyanobacterium]|jgi:tetratricopeptide (TPR) repeat protein/tRNA A-37 threonylcarbamoyl transferase component Bud32
MSDELIGGRYQVVECLRTTSFCKTFLAKDTQLPGNPRCIVKKLQPQSSEEFILDTARRLFGNEAKVLYKLSDHPQIPRLLAHLEVEEQFYLVQEFVEGQDLSQDERFKDGNCWSEAEVKLFLKDVLEILAFVHQNNVIHRDIKPSNIIRRSNDGKMVLIDFGAVKEITNMTLTEGQGNLLTVAVGTPGYMSSEQQRGDPRLNSDIYALGMTAIQALTGFHPDLLPRDRDTGEINWRDRAPNCSQALADIIDRMARNDFTQRYQNVNEVIEDLQRLQGTQRPTLAKSRSTHLTFKARWLWVLLFPVVAILAILAPRIWRAVEALGYYNQGNAMIKEEKYEEAIAAFEQAVTIKPNFVEAWTNQGFAQGKLGKHLEKFSSCARATNIAPDFAEAWNCRGLARADLRQYESALIEFDKAIAVDSQFYNGFFNKGQVLLKMGKLEASIDTTRQVISIDPDYFFAWTQICQALYQLQQYQEAQAHCQESLKINPNHQPTIELLNKVESELNQTSKLSFEVK